MALRINGAGKKYIVPNVLSRTYKYTAFDGPTLTFTVKMANGKVEDKVVNVKTKIEEAWRFVTDRAAVHKPCNDYFKTLARKKTLREVLAEGDIIVHCLVPKEGHTFEELPNANTAGRDIGIDPGLLLEEPIKLACTLIHELAHVAGATTNPADSNAIAAEKALQSCLCAGQFRPEALGLIQQIELRRYGGSRIV